MTVSAKAPTAMFRYLGGESSARSGRDARGEGEEEEEERKREGGLSVEVEHESQRAAAMASFANHLYL